MEIEVKIGTTRHVYGPGDELPQDVDLGVARTWWHLVAIDPEWNHVAVMFEEWSEEAGHWVRVPDNQARLIVCAQGKGRRHPELDDTRHADAAAAWRVAWDAGLLEVVVFPDLRPTT